MDQMYCFRMCSLLISKCTAKGMYVKLWLCIYDEYSNFYYDIKVKVSCKAMCHHTVKSCMRDNFHEGLCFVRAISFNLLHTLNVFSNPDCNIWFVNCVLKRKNEDNIKNIFSSSLFQPTLGAKIF